MTWTEREWFFPSQVSTIILYNWIIDCWVHLSSTAGRLQYDHATASPQPRYSQPIREKASSTVEFLHMLWIDPNGHEGHSSSLWFDTLNTGQSQVDHKSITFGRMVRCAAASWRSREGSMTWSRGAWSSLASLRATFHPTLPMSTIPILVFWADTLESWEW